MYKQGAGAARCTRGRGHGPGGTRRPGAGAGACTPGAGQDTGAGHPWPWAAAGRAAGTGPGVVYGPRKEARRRRAQTANMLYGYEVRHSCADTLSRFRCRRSRASSAVPLCPCRAPRVEPCIPRSRARMERRAVSCMRSRLFVRSRECRVCRCTRATHARASRAGSSCGLESDAR